MAKDKYQVSLKAFLRDPQGRFLFLHARNGGPYSGYYDIPGGRIEDDEFSTPLTEILTREIKEELGDVSFEIEENPVLVSRDEFGTGEKIRVLYLFFEGKYLGGEIKISAEHEEGYVWAMPEEIGIGKNIKPIHREAMGRYFGKVMLQSA